MRKKMFAPAAALALAMAAPLFVGGASVVDAHQGHTSCAGGVVAVIETIDDQDVFPHGPGRGVSGEFASELARAGAVPAAVVDAHNLICTAGP